MIKSAVIFFEHQMPFAQGVLPFLEEKHVIFIVNESLIVDYKKVMDYIWAEFKELGALIRKKRLAQVIFPLVPEHEMPRVQALQESLKRPLLIGVQEIIDDAASRFKRSFQKEGSANTLEVSIEQLRRSSQLVIDEYDEPLLGGLCRRAPKTDITRAPKIMKKRLFAEPVLELKAPIWAFSSNKTLVLKADDSKRPAAALLLNEKIRGGK